MGQEQPTPDYNDQPDLDRTQPSPSQPPRRLDWRPAAYQSGGEGSDPEAPPVRRVPRPGPRRRRPPTEGAPAWVVGLGVGALLAVILLLVVAFVFSRRSSQPEPTPTVMVVTPTATLIPRPTATPPIAPTDTPEAAATAELELCISRIYTYAAMADKYDSAVHSTPFRMVTLAMKEALGVIGIIAPEEAGFIGLISTVLPAIAMGNRVVVIPSQQYALLATDFYQVLDTSDLPGGTVNIVTGDQQVLSEELAKHYDIEGLWYWGTAEGSQLVESEAAATMKRTWVNYGRYHDWEDPIQGEGEVFLRKAVEIKNIWIPYGE